MANVDTSSRTLKAARYASLGPKRKPSTPNPPDINKYERLEDLLREAGYKETRIFTPERTPVPPTKPPAQDDKSRLSGVVNLFSSLVGVNRSSSRPVQPPSPTPRPTIVRPPASPTSSSSSLAPSISRRRAPTDRPSKAHAYLKHMSSAPNLPRHHPLSAHDPAPPLPPSWPEAVARAMLFGGEHAHVGGPYRDRIPPSRPGSPLRHVQNTIDPSQLRGLGIDGLFDDPLGCPTPRGRRMASNDVHVHGGKLQLRQGRSVHSQGTVSLTQVTCQSAPSSRAPSRVRGRKRHPKTGSQPQQPPTLAKTKVEGDVWTLDDPRVAPTVHIERVESQRTHSEASDSEGEGEITLDRLLIPAKRQHSIRSLRQHLTLKSSISDLRQTRPPTPEVREEQGEDEDDEMNRRMNRSRPRSRIPRWK